MPFAAADLDQNHQKVLWAPLDYGRLSNIGK